MFNQIYKRIISESNFTEEDFPTKFDFRPVEIYECIKDVVRVPKELGVWPSLETGKSFYVAPLREHDAQKFGSKIGVNEIVLLKWKHEGRWGIGPKKLTWESYEFILPDFKPLIDNNYVRKIENLNPAEEFIIDYLHNNHFNIWRKIVEREFNYSKDDYELQKLLNACKEKHEGRSFANSDFEDLLNL